jgi:adenylosuccinate synthase
MVMRKATIVVGLGFGDEGKGTTVDHLCRASDRAPLVVRFNGGSQAAHNVITPDGRHHTFAQFGSGSFLPHCKTFLSRFMLVDLFSLFQEARNLIKLGCVNPIDRLFIDREAKIITPFQKSANRLREALRSHRHGSCGMGIGETMADSLAQTPLTVQAKDLSSRSVLVRQLRAIQEKKIQEFGSNILDLPGPLALSLSEDINIIFDVSAPEFFADLMIDMAEALNICEGSLLKTLEYKHSLILEGAQGVLLDEWYGFHPFTTWSTTTTANALTLLDEIEFDGKRESLGILRTYHSRHGAGPFPTERSELTKAIPELHNGQGPWQGGFRNGHFDGVLARYALEVCPVDSMVLTHVDRLPLFDMKYVTAYHSQTEVTSSLKLKDELTDLVYQEGLTRILENSKVIYSGRYDSEDSYIQALEDLCGTPISMLSRGPTTTDKFLRSRVSASALH